MNHRVLDLAGWVASLDAVVELIADRFARSEPRQRVWSSRPALWRRTCRSNRSASPTTNRCVCYNPDQATRDAYLREVMTGKLADLIAGTTDWRDLTTRPPWSCGRFITVSRTASAPTCCCAGWRCCSSGSRRPPRVTPGHTCATAPAAARRSVRRPPGRICQRTELTAAQRDILTTLAIDPPKKIIELSWPPTRRSNQAQRSAGHACPGGDHPFPQVNTHFRMSSTHTSS